MNMIIWIFPMLFLIHELEELLGFEKWYAKKNFIKYPRASKIINRVSDYFSTKGMIFAILEQLLLILIICFIALNYNHYLLWFSGFVGYTLHLIIHVLQSIIIKQVIPK